MQKSKYVPGHVVSADFARQLTKGVTDSEKKFEIVTAWVSCNIFYDFIKATKVAKKRGVLPDPVGCWNNRMGICQDISALTVNMLRAVGIQAYMCIGHADRAYHAWVEATINGKTKRYDHEGKAKKYIRERVY